MNKTKYKIMKNIKVIQELHNLGITGYHEVVYNPSYLMQEKVMKKEHKLQQEQLLLKQEYLRVVLLKIDIL